MMLIWKHTFGFLKGSEMLCSFDLYRNLNSFYETGWMIRTNFLGH